MGPSCRVRHCVGRQTCTPLGSRPSRRASWQHFTRCRCLERRPVQVYAGKDPPAAEQAGYGFDDEDEEADGPVVLDFDVSDDSDEDDDEVLSNDSIEAQLAALSAAPATPGAPTRTPESTRAAELETDVYYQGLLTNEDIAADPPDHRSGYVAIIGRPNAGKSTLLNALLGQKLSIVSPKAQTTRHRILGILSSPTYQAVFMDTPGVVDERRNRLEGRMMAFVKTAMRDADALVAIVDASARDPREVLAMVQPPPGYDGPPMLVVLNKDDLVEPDRGAELEAWWREHCRCDDVLRASALRGDGADAIKAWVVARLPPGPTLYPKKLVSEQPERFFVSEIIREHVFEQYSEEVPYCVQVNVTEFKERKRGKHYVACELVCEKDSQKGILLGARGSAIKALSTAARVDIEEFLGRPVFLELRVRLDKGWRSDAATLKRFGY